MKELVRPDGRIELIKYENAFVNNNANSQIIADTPSKFRSCIIDTINAPQNALYKQINQDKRTTHDQWRDFGWEIYNLFDEIKKLPDTLIILIAGLEGTGKTVGGKFLDPDRNGWINADNKPLSFFGARSMYPPDKSRKNYSTAYTYDDILAAVKAMHAKRQGTFIVYILGHIEFYKGDMDIIYQRLKVLGKQATKLGIEGLNVFATYYTKVNAILPVKDPNRWKLSTASTGYNTARTPEGYHDEQEILNNYQIITDRVLEDYGEIKPLAPTI